MSRFDRTAIGTDATGFVVDLRMGLTSQSPKTYHKRGGCSKTDKK